MRGMRRAGMAAVGKHFPGHGSVEADSHVASPVDARPLETLRFEDMLAFERMIHYGLPAVMPAHVVYPKVDARPAGFSHYWLQSVLRQQLRFSGAVFSDDISMAGAAVAGDLVARAQTALAAGCDMVLVCNDRAGAINIFERLKVRPDPVAGIRLARMHRHECANREDVIATSDYQAAVNALTTLEREPELDLGDDNLS
jgi:beta-N-acetylhexosaminidase